MRNRSTIKPVSTSTLYKEVRVGSLEYKERNDCAVVAVAITADVPYAAAHKALEAHGRRRGHGTYMHQTIAALQDLGRTVKAIDPKAMMANYPSPHRELLKNVTTHHPRRFPGAFDPSKLYLLRTARHILAVRSGEVQDWTINKAMRVREIYEVS